MAQTSGIITTAPSRPRWRIAPGRLASEFGRFARSRLALAPLDWGIAGLVFAGALVADFHQISGASLWFDETFSIGAAGQPLHVMFGQVWKRDPNMQLYYTLLHFWLLLTTSLGLHPTETVTRAPSAVSAALSSAALYLLGRRFLGQMAGVISATLYTLSFFILMSAQQARSYSLQLLFIIIAWYMVFGALHEEDARARRWWWTLYALAITIGFYAHLYTFFTVVAQMTALVALVILPGLWRGRAIHSLVPAAQSLVVIVVLILPLIYIAHHDGSHIGWVPPATPKDVYEILFKYISSADLVYMYLLFALVLLALALTLVGRLVWRDRSGASPTTPGGWFSWRIQPPPPGVTLLLCWMVAPFALTYAITQPYLNLHFFFSRYEVVIMPAICLLAGLGIQLLPVRASQVMVIVALLEIVAVSAPYYYTHNQIQDFRDPVTWMQTRYQPADGLICFPNDLCSIPVQAYLSAYPGAAHFDVDSPGVYSWVKGYAVPVTLARAQTYAAHHTRIFYIVATLGGTKSDPSIDAAIRQWLASRYILSGEQASSGVIVYLYTPRPPQPPAKTTKTTKASRGTTATKPGA
ncbi:MAG TPA: glycosyltransferase family 39 protein [Ktedonobacterales bacterium]